jgi:phosphatidylglycerophosphate synthase
MVHNDTIQHVGASRDRFPTDAVVIALAALAAVSGISVLALREWRLTAWYPIKASGLFSAIMLIALARLQQHHPYASFGAANLLTTARAAVGVLLTSLIGESLSAILATTAAAVGLVVLMLDGLDGWLARRTKMVSAFGARFDVEVDALLILTLAILAWQEGKAGQWVMLSGLLRYGFVVAGWLLPWMQRPLAPTSRGRIICVVQTAALVVVLAPAVTPPLSSTIAALGLAALCYSFLVDTMRLWRQSPDEQPATAGRAG